MHAYNAEEVCAHLRGCWKKRIQGGQGRGWIQEAEGGAGVEVKEELRWRLRGVGGGVIYAFN